MRFAATHRYRIAGLGLQSAFVLHGAVEDPANGAPDVVIADGRAAGPAPEWTRHATSADGRRVRLVAEGVGRFLVEDGTSVTVWPADDGDAGSLAQWLMGPVLAVVLLQHGRLVLHAATVQIGASAVVVVGHSGTGKSTLAAAWAARGHAVLADDITVLECPAMAPPRVAPHAPLVRLQHGPPALPAVAHWNASGKQVYALPAAATEEVPTIAAIVTLADGDPHVERLGPGAAAFALVTYSFCEPILTGAQRAANLRQCAEAAAHIPVWRVVRPRDLAALPALMAQIETLAGYRRVC